MDSGLQPSNDNESNRRLALFLLSFGLLAAGLLLILVVAPDLTVRVGNFFTGYVDAATPEYWAAMFGGAICLSLGGFSLVKALTS